MTTQTVKVQEIQDHGGLPITNAAEHSVAALPATTYPRRVYLTTLDGANPANHFYSYIVGTGWTRDDVASGSVDDTAYNAGTWDGVTTIAPSKNAVRDKIETLAPLASPALTGSPTAPTQTAADNSTKIATTAYADGSASTAASSKVDDTAYNAGTWDAVTGVAPSKNAVRDKIEALNTAKADLASPALTGVPTAPTAAQGTNTTQLATTAMVHSEAVLLAPLASPVLTGNPTAPTPSVNDNDTSIATTAFVSTQIAAYVAANDVEVFKGAIDCSASPNYPAADAGNVYRVSVAGKIGGASGVVVEVGDRLECLVDSTASGNQATVGANWMINQVNIDGAVVGPAAATSGNLPTFNGTSGKLIQDGGVALASLAPLASPAFTGNPTATTQAAGNNSTRLATTAYADALVVDSIADADAARAPSRNAVFDALALKADLASPALTGTPTAPTAAAATNTTQVATTAMVQAAAAAKRYAADIGDGTTEDIVITHSLNTTDVDVTFRDAAGAKMKRIVPWAPTSVNAITAYFPTGAPPAAAEVRVVVQA